MSLRRCFGWVPLELRLALALAGLLVGVLLLVSLRSTAQAASSLYVAPSGADSGDCRNSSAPCATPQYAVDRATSGDEIRLAAGTYTGVQMHTGITQTVYLSKTLTIRGGYTLSNWDIPDPIAHPTTLDAQGRGRVFYITGSISPTLEGVRMVNGDATAAGETSSSDANGGGIFSITATTTLRENWIVGNHAWNGGGLYVLGGATWMRGNTIAQNSTSAGQTGGGGVSLFNSTALLDSNQILSNTARYERFPAPVPAPSMGGGLLIISSVVTLRDNTIADNKAFLEGGGLDVGGSVITMTGNLIADNVVESTTGVGGGLRFHFSNGAVISNTITSNRSFGAAGGVDITFSPNILLRRNLIADNAATSGAGIYLNQSDSLLDSNLVIRNRAVDGGGMRLGESSPTIMNTVIADNTADNGSGVYLDNGAPHFIQTTIARNRASDGGGNGIYIRSVNRSAASLILINTILAGHTVGLSVTTGVTATVNGVLWFGNGANISSEGTITIANAVTGDPAFTVDGYHLTACSAARGRGVDAGVATDIDGDLRPATAIDLGADQFVLASATCRKAYLPVVEHAAGTIPLHTTAIAVLTRVAQNHGCPPDVNATYFRYFILCGGPAGHGFSMRMTYFSSEAEAVETFNAIRHNRPILDFHGYTAYTNTDTVGSQTYIQEHTWLAHTWIITALTSDSLIRVQNPQYISDDVYGNAQYLRLFSLKAYQAFLPVISR